MGDLIAGVLTFVIFALPTWLTIWCGVSVFNSRDQISAWRVVRAVVALIAYAVLISPFFPAHHY